MNLKDELEEKLPEEHAQKAAASLKAWADNEIEVEGAVKSLSPERLEQENAAMLEATGLNLEQSWSLYNQMYNMTEGDGRSPEDAITLSVREGRGLARWITILVRARMEAMARTRELAYSLELATIYLQRSGLMSAKQSAEKGN
jgi:hypothetical protein